MKRLTEFIISEKLKIRKSKQNNIKYGPKSLEDLKILIKEKVENNKGNILDLTDIDVSNLTSLENMISHTYLDGANDKIDTIDVSGWDVSNVKNFKRAFCGRLGNYITTINGLDDWDVSNGVTFREFFSGCKELKYFDGVQNFNFSKNCIDITYFFASCQSLIDIDLSEWDVSNIQWMGGLFFNCSGLEKFSFKNWKTSNIYSTASMFKNCYRLEKIIDTNGLDMTTCTDINAMFYDCKNLKSIEGIENWNTKNLNTIEHAFEGCKKLQCDLSKWVLKQRIVKKSAFTGTSPKLFIKP